ncbi:hypothetical protein LI939_04290 [Cutibacterium acnes]|uniref:Uncharacterized protein n=1 Tax=Cutibacterium acnes TaxID=1747 RepID=A0AA44U5M0_CUTAC|nr:hypothetical protein [Cutibacterium acnes]MCD1081738.1 hypothetical protein [Cutibacterium acnes]MDK7569588.1 hypothetical protein [Cutibacterium acnes]MDK8279808.1 hypothetical protein [Cutibacterium acnes]PHJ28017.1 hypothetical protein APS60_00560 [Cutibacterium acnes]REB64614.1 hypothetical protein CP873_06095 [Cutibacterium acnes]
MVHCPTATVAARPERTPWVLDSTTIGLAPVRTRMAREFLDAGPDVAGEVAAARAGGPGSFRVQLRDALDKAARTAK